MPAHRQGHPACRPLPRAPPWDHAVHKQVHRRRPREDESVLKERGVDIQAALKQNHDRYTLSHIFKVLIFLRNQHPAQRSTGHCYRGFALSPPARPSRTAVSPASAVLSRRRFGGRNFYPEQQKFPRSRVPCDFFLSQGQESTNHLRAASKFAAANRAASAYSGFLALRDRTLNQIGVPLNPNASRIWFSRKRSKLKCSLMSRSVNRMNVGGATAACVI